MNKIVRLLCVKRASLGIGSYIDLGNLLEEAVGTKAERRAFGLEHSDVAPVEQLLLWLEKHGSKLKQPSQGQKVTEYLHSVTFVLVMGVFLLGCLSGIGLLHYSGERPVNVLFFMGVVVFLPLITLGLGLFTILKSHKRYSTLVRLSPAFWLERLLALLPQYVQTHIERVSWNALLLNWLVIQRAQVLALAFSVGILVALVIVVVTQDIAFSWSTTLQVTAEEFYTFVYTLAFPWREFIDSAVPSLTLVEQSQYFRLGEGVDDRFASHAAILGGWWKFLALATFFYAIMPRLLLYGFVSFWGRRVLQKSILSLEGAKALLYHMNEPLVETQAVVSEKVCKEEHDVLGQYVGVLEKEYHTHLLWAGDEEKFKLIEEVYGFSAIQRGLVGGINKLAIDEARIRQSSGKVIVSVKAWEPPVMDIIDFLEALSNRVERITLLPLGTFENHCNPEVEDVHMWASVLGKHHLEKVWIYAAV
jgi:hypothetical protein